MLSRPILWLLSNVCKDQVFSSTHLHGPELGVEDPEDQFKITHHVTDVLPLKLPDQPDNPRMGRGTIQDLGDLT